MKSHDKVVVPHFGGKIKKPSNWTSRYVRAGKRASLDVVNLLIC